MNLNRPCTNTNRVVALLVMLSFTFPLSFAEGVPFEEWLPGDVVFLVAYDSAHDSQVEFPNFSEGVTQWMETLDDIFEFRVAKEFISLTQDRTHLNQDFSALVGDRFTMTIRGLDPGAAKLPSFFFLSEVADPGKADEVLQSCFESVSALTGKARMDVDAYNGHVIRSLSGPVVIPGLELSYTIIDSLLILSSSKPAIIGLLQDREYEENRLADNVVYQKVLENLPDNRQLTFFVDFNSITQTVSQVLEFISLIQGEEATSNKELIKLIEAIPLLSSIKGHGVGVVPSTSASEPLTVTGFTLVESQEESPFAFLDREPELFRFETYLPRRTGSFSSGNIMNLSDVWQLVKLYIPVIPNGPALFEPVLQSEAVLGFSLENDLFGWMGNEWCFVRPVMDLEAVVPMNHVAYMVAVNDLKAAKDGLARIEHAMKTKIPVPIRIETSVMENTQISSVRLPLPVVPLIPSWCVTDDGLFILATDLSIVQEMLQCHSGARTGIVRNARYSDLRHTLSGKAANKFAFQDVYNELVSYREAMRRVMSALEQSTENKPEAMSGLVLLDRVSYLMHCMQIFKASTKISRSTDDGVLTHQYLHIQDLSLVPPIQSVARFKTVLLPDDNGSVKVVKQLASQCRPEEAARIYEILAEFFPNNAAYLQSLTHLYAQLGEPQKSVEVYNRSLEIMPNTALVIHRETVIEKPVAQIIEQVEAEAQKSRRIKADYAYFGIALAFRDQGKKEVAESLLTHLIDTYPDSDLLGAAARERQLLRSEAPENLIHFASVQHPVIVDGHIDSGLWEQGEPVTFTSETPTEGWSAKARFVRDDDRLYILLQGKKPQEHAPIRNADIGVLLCPNRDYSSVYSFRAEINADEVDGSHVPVQQHLWFTQIHVLDLVLEEEVKDAIQDGRVWKCAVQHEPFSWSAEIAIPLDLVGMDVNAMDGFGLLNVVLGCELENNQKITQSLQKEKDAWDVFSFPVFQGK
jgi:tetratricopeptide (TPR) repeat protein